MNWYTQIRALFIGLLMLAVSACAVGDGKRVPGPLGQRVDDAVIDVSDENRDLRVCWLAAGAVEVMTDLAQRGGDIPTALGHLVMLQGAIDKAHLLDPFWIETDTADVALLFAAVLKDVGKSRLSQILLGGPTVSNFLNVAKRTVILTVKGHAVMRDINRVLKGVEDGVIQKADAWKSCENRTAMNRNILYMLTGVTTLSSTSFWEKQMLAGIKPGTIGIDHSDAGGWGIRMAEWDFGWIYDKQGLVIWPPGIEGIGDGGSVLILPKWIPTI